METFARGEYVYVSVPKHKLCDLLTTLDEFIVAAAAKRANEGRGRVLLRYKTVVPEQQPRQQQVGKAVVLENGPGGKGFTRRSTFTDRLQALDAL